jgi:hypothetical protein
MGRADEIGRVRSYVVSVTFGWLGKLHVNDPRLANSIHSWANKAPDMEDKPVERTYYQR